MIEGVGERVALDHNFPQALLSTLTASFEGMSLVPISKINPALAELKDDELIVQLSLSGIECLVTQDNFTRSPETLVAVSQTRMTVFIVDGVGHDPIRALGAVLLGFTAAYRRRVQGRGNVLVSRPRDPVAHSPHHFLGILAKRRGISVEELFRAHERTSSELRQRLI